MTGSYLLIGLDFVAAFLVGTGLIRILLYIAYHRGLFDMPDERKVHTQPVPRLGGMSFLPTIIIVISLTIGVLYRFELVTMPFGDNVLFIRVLYMIGGAFILYLLGVADDLAGVGFKAKLVMQFIASAVMVSSGLWLNKLYGILGIWRIPFYIGMPLTLFVLMWMINALNMIDGIDGLSSGLASISLLVLTVIFVYELKFVYAMTALATLGAVLAFMRFNLFGSAAKKTKLYMGDTGSLTLGLILCFLIITLCSFVGHNGLTRNCKYFVLAFSSLLIPMLDVLRLVIVRLRRHMSPFLPDMNHIHHKLMRCGYSDRQTLVIILGLDILFILLNAGLCIVLNVNVLIVLDVVLYFALHYLINRKIARVSAAKS